MHLRPAGEVESIGITLSSGNRREYKSAGPVPAPFPGPPRFNQSDRQTNLVTSPCAVLIGCALFFLHGKSRGL